MNSPEPQSPDRGEAPSESSQTTLGTSSPASASQAGAGREARNEAATQCGVPRTCQRVVPRWLVLLDNLPTLALFLLGAALMARVWRPLGLVFLLYCGLTIVAFWGRICVHCHHFGTRACPCGYGVLAPRLFKWKGDRNFRQVFRRNIVILFPCWFLPPIAGAWLLTAGFSWGLASLLGVFCVTGFLMIPLISKYVGCRGCGLRNRCPWMS